MSYPQPARRRLPVWAWILIAAAAVAGLAVGLVAAGVIGYGVATTGRSDVEHDKRFTAQDPAGSSACHWLDMHLNGVGSWQDARDAAGKATTRAVRDASSARSMYDACVAAGANMSPWREPSAN